MDFLGRSIPEARRMSGGFYRVSGFYSHPLTLAAVGLAIFGFIGSLLMQNEFVNKRWQLCALLFTSAYFVFASGGRVASLLVIAYGLFILLVSYFSPKKFAPHRSKKKFLSKLFVISVIISLSLFILHQIGLLNRFFNLSTFANNNEFERLTFWQVHWRMFLDQPWFGQGLALLSAFKRNDYYDLLGFANLQNKYAAHNMFLEILSNVGIIGFFVILFGSVEVWRAIQTRTSRNQIYVKALLTSFALNFLNGMTQNVFFDSSVMYMYLSLMMLMIWSDIRDSLKGTPRHHQTQNRQAVVNSSNSDN
jgi:O-antigen ligase